MFQGREAELKERVDRDRVRLVHADATDLAGVSREVRAFRAQLAILGHVPADGGDLDLAALCDRAAADVEVAP